MASKKKVGGKEVTRVFETYIYIYITLLKYGYLPYLLGKLLMPI